MVRLWQLPEVVTDNCWSCHRPIFNLRRLGSVAINSARIKGTENVKDSNKKYLHGPSEKDMGTSLWEYWNQGLHCYLPGAQEKDHEPTLQERRDVGHKLRTGSVTQFQGWPPRIKPSDPSFLLFPTAELNM